MNLRDRNRGEVSLSALNLGADGTLTIGIHNRHSGSVLDPCRCNLFYASMNSWQRYLMLSSIRASRGRLRLASRWWFACSLICCQRSIGGDVVSSICRPEQKR
jgi:hypothetical protein